MHRAAAPALGYLTVGEWLRNRLLPAVLVGLATVLVARAATWFVDRYRAAADARYRDATGARSTAPEVLKRSVAVGQITKWGVVVTVDTIGTILAIHTLGISIATLVAPATIAGIALGFGAQQIVGDLLAGFFLFAERQFGFGDVIRFAPPGQTVGVTGTVEELTLRITRLRTAQGELVIVPNGSLRQVTNLSKDWSRAVVDIPIPTNEDVERATWSLREVARALAGDEQWRPLLLGEPVLLGAEELEVDVVRIRIVARTLPGRQFEVARELRLRCAVALSAAGIEASAIRTMSDRGEGT